MQLFKRVLLSVFPDEIITQNVNPASMFVSFISTKEFFSVINRKIVENYKLNLFDIGLDPFEFKIGFGDKPSIKLKNLDLYYSYCCAANLNGYRFLNPANLSTSVALISSIYTNEIFSKYPQAYFLNFLYTIYLLSFVFWAKMKKFPNTNEQENFNRFIEIFFEFYEFVFSQTGHKLSLEKFKEIKKQLLSEVEIFFMLKRFYQKLEKSLHNQTESEEEFFSRLFYEELQKNDYKIIIKDFIRNHEEYCYSTKFSLTEKKLLSLILPADILLRYIFLDTDIGLVTEHITSKIFDTEKLDELLKSFRKNDDKLEEFLLYATDYRNYKKNFFEGVKKYMTTAFNDLDEEEEESDFVDLEEIDEMMSSIGNDVENLESFKIPERIKKESKMMEKILNFYITLIGGFWIARGDNFYLRIFKKDLLESFFDGTQFVEESPETMNYYGSLLYNYGKNVFYYKYASENVRSGKQKFFVPYKSNLKSVYSNIYILKLLDENFLATILQDTNPKDIRIFVKNKKVLNRFRENFAKEISQHTQKSNSEFIKFAYQNIENCLKTQDFHNKIFPHINENDIYHLKENVYELNFRLSKTVYKEFQNIKKILNEIYSDTVLLGIFSYIKETFFGFCLYLAYIQDLKNKNKYNYEILRDTYIEEVLNITETLTPQVKELLQKVFSQFQEILQQRISMDDNEAFFHIARENRKSFSDKLTTENIKQKITGEDIIRFRGFLKNITYYNKRFLIPRNDKS